MKNEKRERLYGLDEIYGAKITLNNLERMIKASSTEITKDHILFQIMLMRSELDLLEQYELEQMYKVQTMARKQYIDREVESRLKCYNAPCHTCHHLYTSECYGPDKEVLEEIKRRYNGQI